MFKALLLKQEENKKATATVEDIDVSKLPEGDVLVKINYSTKIFLKWCILNQIILSIFRNE